MIKAPSTALGESMSDYLVHVMAPVAAVELGLIAVVAALALQLLQRRYRAWPYWLAVVMVGVFGRMAADVLHVGFDVPYAASSVPYAIALAVVFATWRRTERTLSIHTIDSQRRKLFYWAAVVATFAMGTAVGDLTAVSLKLGYVGSMLLFAGIIVIPAVGYWKLRWNAVLAFWMAYVITRPLGASFANRLGKPRDAQGLGWGDGRVSALLVVLIAGLIAFLAVTHQDVQRGREVDGGRPPIRPTGRHR